MADFVFLAQMDIPTELEGEFNRIYGLAFARLGFVRHFLGPRVLAKADRWVLVRTQGRFTSLGPPVFPTLVLSTIGAQSGEERQVPLVYVPDAGDHIVVASNWGREKHPAWSANLIAHPDADVIHKEGNFAVTARLMPPPEKARRWAELVEVMPQWDVYTTLTDRDLRVFVLEPR